MKSTDYEKLIANIYKELSPSSIVKHDDKIYERDSEQFRQIDISIRSQIAGHEILTVIEARDYKRPLNVIAIDAFASKLKGIQANKGILICNSGFTQTAITKAKNVGIELCTAHDANSKNWNQAIDIPFVWIDLTPTIYLSGETFFEAGDTVPIHFSKMIFSNDKGNTRVNLLDDFIKLWNEDLLPKEIGKIHTFIPTQENLEISTIKKEYRSISNLKIKYNICRRSWLKYFPANDYRGIQNYLTKDFTPSRLNIGPVPLIRDESWNEIEDISTIPCKCFMLISTEFVLDGNSSAQFTLIEGVST